MSREMTNEEILALAKEQGHKNRLSKGNLNPQGKKKDCFLSCDGCGKCGHGYQKNRMCIMQEMPC